MGREGTIPGPMEVRLRELEEELASLRAENERLKKAPMLAFEGTLTAVAGTGTRRTVLGAEEMILQVGEDDRVRFVNGPMANLLMMTDRKKALGTPLAAWDKGPLGDGLLETLVRVARGSGEHHVLERSCAGLASDRLPTVQLPKGAEERILRFVATPQEGQVHVVAQDVTRIRWLEQTFARYVSTEVLEYMQQAGSSDFLSMQRREITVLFGDMRGFTGMCQELTPEEIQETINSFLGRMVQVVETFGGTIDKFIGDEVMVLFGAPLAQQDHALRGLVAAVEMQRAHLAWQEARCVRGEPHRPMGIGLATGTVAVGNIGTPSRMDYTALGHTVNLAARLCGAAEAGEILTIGETHRTAMSQLKLWQGRGAVPRLSFRPKGQMKFKNVAQPVEVVVVASPRIIDK